MSQSIFITTSFVAPNVLTVSCFSVSFADGVLKSSHNFFNLLRDSLGIFKADPNGLSGVAIDDSTKIKQLFYNI